MNIDHRVVRAYVDAMRNYGKFNGRTAPSDFLLAQWIFVPLIALTSVFGIPLLDSQTDPRGHSRWPYVLDFFVVLPHVVPWAALMVRRLHDMDHHGAWAWFAVLPVGFILPFTIVGLIVWGSRPGTAGPNRFGPNPLGNLGQPAQQPTSVGLGTIMQPSVVTEPLMFDVIAEIERLAQLRDNGALSETEFDVMKAQVLGRRGPS